MKMGRYSSVLQQWSRLKRPTNWNEHIKRAATSNLRAVQVLLRSENTLPNWQVNEYRPSLVFRD